MEKEFLHLINQNQGILLKICRMYFKDKGDSEDLFQEIVLQLWKSYPNFKGNCKETTWMYRVGLNVAITDFKKKNKQYESESKIEFPGSYSTSEESNIKEDLLEELQLAIDNLNRFDKALMMLYLEEKSYKEIAEIMGFTESNVGVKINRIKKKLQNILNP